MIKNDKETFTVGAISKTATLLSVCFTMMLFMTFGTGWFDKGLLGIAGIVNDGAKAFCLIQLIKYCKAKLYPNATLYGIMFIIFGLISLAGSVSYMIYQAKNQMYHTENVINTEIATLEKQIQKTEDEINKLEFDKTAEINRVNSVIDSLPANQITNRSTYEQQKQTTINLYDTKINELKPALTEKQAKYDGIDKTAKTIRVLNDNALTGLLETISQTLKISLDGIVVAFAILIGGAMDFAMIAFTYDKAFSYRNNTERKLEQNKIDTVRNKNTFVKAEPKKPKNVVNIAAKNNSIENFLKENNLTIDDINYDDVKHIASKRTYYRYKNKIM